MATDPLSKTSLTDLYQRQRGPMIRFARLLTGSGGVAEEIVQEAFLKVHQTNKEILNPDAYLRTVVANLCRSHMRRIRLERRLQTPSRIILEEPELDETWAAVCRLPFRLRAVLVLRYYQDMSEAEIAEALVDAARDSQSRLHRGLSKMREELT